MFCSKIDYVLVTKNGTDQNSIWVMSSFVLQTSALDALKAANPDRQYWIKLDATLMSMLSPHFGPKNK